MPEQQHMPVWEMDDRMEFAPYPQDGDAVMARCRLQSLYLGTFEPDPQEDADTAYCRLALRVELREWALQGCVMWPAETLAGHYLDRIDSDGAYRLLRVVDLPLALKVRLRALATSREAAVAA